MGFRPHTTRSFCFGKRTQNHWRPGVALRVSLPFLVILDICNRGSSVFAFSCVREEKDTGFPIGVGNDRKRAAELASLRQSSPPHRFRDRGAATPAGAGEMLLPPVVPPDPSLRFLRLGSGQAKEENSYPNKDSCSGSGLDRRGRSGMMVVSLRLSSNSRRNREGSRSLRSPNRNRLRQWSRDTRSLARVRPT